MQGSATPPSTPKYQQFRAIRGIQLSTTTTEEGVQGTSSSLEGYRAEEVEGVTSEEESQVGDAAGEAVAAVEAAAVAVGAAAVAVGAAAVGEGDSLSREP